YIVEQYGRNQVAHIITHGTMAAKSSIKDVARVMDLPLPESIRLSNLVPSRPGTSLHEILHIDHKDLEEREATSPEEIQNILKLQEEYKGEGLIANVLHEAEILEGTVRNTGIHAAGILIGPKDLTEIMPLCRQKDVDLYITQFPGNCVEEAGAIKIDILGLSNLTIIRNTLEMVKENHGIDIAIDHIPLDDPLTYKLYQDGETDGTFQFASTGMKKYLRDLKPDNIEDLIAMNALFRPGPMAYIPEFIERKHGRKKIEYDLPEMEEILKETYGITVYQEQVMLLSQKLAGFSKGDADILRKAMGKKQIAVLQKMYDKFIEGAIKNGHPEEVCKKIWNDWVAFAQYAFNKSHSTCYAYLAYQTAYLKANYLPEYMAALLNAQGNIEGISQYMFVCRRMNLKVHGPDVNESKKKFSVNREGVIRFGLGAIKGIGEFAVDDIIQEREKNGAFSSVFDLVKRLSTKSVNRRTFESLIMAGALDCFPEIHRAQYLMASPNENMTNLEKILKYAQQINSKTGGHTMNLFGETGLPEIPIPRLHPTEEWTLSELLEKEKEMVGMYISAHPLDHFQFELTHYGTIPVTEFQSHQQSTRSLRIAGYMASVQHLITKKGSLYGKFKLIDYNGEYEFALYKEDYLKYKDMIQNNNKVMIMGTFQSSWNNPDEKRFRIQQMLLLEDVKKKLTKPINMTIQLDKLDSAFLEIIQKYANQSGYCELGIQIVEPNREQTVKLRSGQRRLELSDDFLEALNQMDGLLYQVITN
ncbi:MAG TPA: DNA polymerase III subunit alpha, partial [Chitinophagaceae bacterium]|nr:DNA polymerase III subunit alpha [Chitinophagaceae bacterium]